MAEEQDVFEAAFAALSLKRGPIRTQVTKAVKKLDDLLSAEEINRRELVRTIGIAHEKASRLQSADEEIVRLILEKASEGEREQLYNEEFEKMEEYRDLLSGMLSEAEDVLKSTPSVAGVAMGPAPSTSNLANVTGTSVPVPSSFAGFSFAPPAQATTWTSPVSRGFPGRAAAGSAFFSCPNSPPPVFSSAPCSSSQDFPTPLAPPPNGSRIPNEPIVGQSVPRVSSSVGFTVGPQPTATASGTSPLSRVLLSPQTAPVPVPRTSVATRKYKAANLNPVKFSGEITEWLPFWENFNFYVHLNDEDYPTVHDKFEVLIGLLEGEARKAFEGYFLSSGNYEQLRVELKLRYAGEHNETIVKALVKKLADVDAVTDATQVKALRQLVDEIKVYVQSLKTLQVDSTTYGLFVKSLIEEKLPPEFLTQWRWETRGNREQRENFDLFLRFLNDKVDSLEVPGAESPPYPPPGSRKKSLGLVRTEDDGTGTGSKYGGAQKCFCCGRPPWHKLVKCRTFLKWNPKQRVDFCQKKRLCFRCFGNSHRIKDCRASLKCSVPGCPKTWHHHDLLHGAYFSPPQQDGGGSASDGQEHARSTTHASVCVTPADVILSRPNTVRADQRQDQTIFKTMLVDVTGPKGTMRARVLLDGASDYTFVRTDVVKHLGLRGQESREFHSVVFGGGSVKTNRQRVSLKLKSVFGGPAHSLDAWTTAEITLPLDPVSIPPKLLDGIQFSEDFSDVSSPKEVHILIGTDNYWSVVQLEARRLTRRLVLQDSIFGPFLHGCIPTQDPRRRTLSRTHFTRDIHDAWDLASIGIGPSELAEPDLPEPKYVAQAKRIEVGLPFKNEQRPGDNKAHADARLDSMVAKLTDHDVRAYQAYLNAQEKEGIIHRISDGDQPPPPGYYLPHKAVWRAEKLRVVYDGGAGGPHTPSINQLLHTGPNLLPMLVKILMQFRYRSTPFTSDIRKAFLQLLVREEDTVFLRFLWMNRQVYQFCRLPFGLSASPYLLNVSIRFLFLLFEDLFPRSVEILRDSVYVDDLVGSVDSERELEQLREEASTIFLAVSMELKEWTFSAGGRGPLAEEDGASESCSVLGVPWNRVTDDLAVNTAVCRLPPGQPVSRRRILSSVSSIFDPLGMLNYWTVGGRVLMQRSWSEKRKWDEPLSGELQDEFGGWVNEGIRQDRMAFPRYVHLTKESEVHVFTDASERAFACCIYVVNRQEKVSHLLISRFRVAPKRPKMSIPRLELLAALIGARLYELVHSSRGMSDIPAYFWTDSETVRFWIRKGPASLKLFESNRVKEISEKTTSEWRRVETSENPADLATRGISLRNPPSLWWTGPAFLLLPPEQWPSFQEPTSTDSGQEALRRTLLTVVAAEALFPLQATAAKSVRLLACWFKLMRILRQRAARRKAGVRVNADDWLPWSGVSACDIRKANDYWIRVGQLEEFGDDFQRLMAGKEVLHSSRLSLLRPFLHPERWIIMIRPRTNPDKPLPLLSTRHPYARLVIHDRHRRMLHAGPQATLAEVLRNFHLLKGLSTVKRSLKLSCYNCRRTRGIPFRSREGHLPDFRSQPSRPFEHTGIDYLGPINVAEGGEKHYILVFVCAVTRAIHLELTPSMAREDTELAIRRFQARRGAVARFYSDNAMSFMSIINRRDLITATDWKLFPPYACWWRGFYERFMADIKRSLRSELMNCAVPFMLLLTVVQEIEAAINNRPLLQVTPDDEHPLTPSHFLFGSPPPSELENGPSELVSPLEAWKSRLQHTEAAWKKFRSSYLQSIRQWRRQQLGSDIRKPRAGEIVLVADQSVPRLRWAFARVLRVREHDADILVRGKNTSRALRHLYPLEAAPDLDGEEIAVIPEEIASEALEPPEWAPEVAEVRDNVPSTSRFGRLIRRPARYDE